MQWLVASDESLADRKGSAERQHRKAGIARVNQRKRYGNLEGSAFGGGILLAPCLSYRWHPAGALPLPLPYPYVPLSSGTPAPLPMSLSAAVRVGRRSSFDTPPRSTTPGRKKRASSKMA
jgi:hypothetical protein